jgi:predicted hydrocarbon binding protein
LASLIKKKIGEISLDEETGRLFDDLTGSHLFMMDEDFYRGLRNRLYDTFQTGASVILHQIGMGYGEVMGKAISALGGSRLQNYRKFIDRGRHQGYGIFHVPLLETLTSSFRGEVIVRLKNSFFSLSAGVTGQTECQIVAGMIAGAAPFTIGKKEFNCVETKCLSKGDTFCEFRLKAE